MPRITFIEHDGRAHVVDARTGGSLMRAALDHGAPGIMADCRGEMTCGSCHGYIDERWSRASSRLTCQLTVQAWMDGMIVRLPAARH